MFPGRPFARLPCTTTPDLPDKLDSLSNVNPTNIITKYNEQLLGHVIWNRLQLMEEHMLAEGRQLRECSKQRRIDDFRA